MVVGHAVKPAALVAGALNSPGTLNTVVLFTIVAAAELLLNDTIFVCPCSSDLSAVYGFSFMLIPSIILFLADFPWKLVKKFPSAAILCSLIRRPIGLAVTWVIIGSLQRKYVDCIMEAKQEECEKSVRSTWFQLLGLYTWLLIIVCAFALVLCRRRRTSCIKGRSTALEMQIKFELEEKRERAFMERKLKYGETRLQHCEEGLSLEAMQNLQPGLSGPTYSALQSEHLLQPGVLRFLREEDVFSLDVSLAQRCLMRNLIDSLRQNPNLLTEVKSLKEPETVTPVAVGVDGITVQIQSQ